MNNIPKRSKKKRKESLDETPSSHCQPCSQAANAIYRSSASYIHYLFPSLYLETYIFLNTSAYFLLLYVVHQNLLKQCEHPHGVQMDREIGYLNIDFRMPLLVCFEPPSVSPLVCCF